MRALFPSESDRARIEEDLAALLRGARERVAAGPVAPQVDWGEALRDVAAFDFADPLGYHESLAWAVAQLERGVTQTTHPRYFGLFNPAPSFPAECADRIAAQFNPQLASATTSPAAVAIEAHVIRAVGERAGLGPNVAGHFTSGGSEANFTALLCALVAAEPGYAGRGVRAFAGDPVFYVSDDAHLAWRKIALQAGLGHMAMRAVTTDGTGRMDPAALEGAIKADRASGRCPVMVAATAGTTAAGMIDPLPRCAGIAREHGLWFHVDAAWAGALIASPRLAHALAGIEAADSVTIDAHKWFATTMGCGMVLTPRRHILPEAFGVAASYMPSGEATRDPYVLSLQWSRRFLGLRLFLTLAVAGWDGVARHVEHSLTMAELLRHEMTDAGWTVANRSPAAVVCLVPPDGAPPVRTLAARVVADGAAWLSAARFGGRDVVRACVTHGLTSEADVRTLANALRAALAEQPTYAV